FLLRPLFSRFAIASRGTVGKKETHDRSHFREWPARAPRASRTRSPAHRQVLEPCSILGGSWVGSGTALATGNPQPKRACRLSSTTRDPVQKPARSHRPRRRALLAQSERTAG